MGKLYIGYSNNPTTVIVVKATSEEISFPRKMKVKKAAVRIRGLVNQNKQAIITKFNPFFSISLISLSLFSSTFLKINF